MINFVNTEIVEEGLHIGVAIYYINFEKASTLIDKLKTNEKVLYERKYRNHHEVGLEKDGYEIRILALPMNDSTRGNKHHYSFIDKYSFGDDRGLEFLNTRILTSTVDYNMERKYKSEDHYEPRFLLY